MSPSHQPSLQLNAFAKPFVPKSSVTVRNPLPPITALDEETGGDEDGTNIIDLPTSILCLILQYLTPSCIVCLASTCRAIRVRVQGLRLPTARAVAEFIRPKETTASRDRPSDLVSALFSACSIISNPCVANDVMEELVRGEQLTESDGEILISKMAETSDDRTTRVLGFLRRLPGFDACMKASTDCYCSLLHCACAECRAGVAEKLLEDPQTDITTIVSNGIVDAPILHWYLIKWSVDDMKKDSRKMRIIRAMLMRPDVDLNLAWKGIFFTRKPMEIVWDCDLPSEKDNLDAKEELLKILDGAVYTRFWPTLIM